MASTDRTKRGKRASIIRWIALALVIHAEVGLVVGVALYFWAPRQADVDAKRREATARAEPISVSTVDEDTARKIIADLEHQEEKAKKEELKKEEEALKAPGQVVDLPRPRDERRPDEARYAAEYDSWVEKETKRYGKFDPNSQQRHSGEVEPNKRNAPALTPNPSEAPASPGPLAMRMPADRDRQSRPRPGETGQEDQPGSEEQMPSDSQRCVLTRAAARRGRCRGTTPKPRLGRSRASMDLSFPRSSTRAPWAAARRTICPMSMKAARPR